MRFSSEMKIEQPSKTSVQQYTLHIALGNLSNWARAVAMGVDKESANTYLFVAHVIFSPIRCRHLTQ